MKSMEVTIKVYGTWAVPVDKTVSGYPLAPGLVATRPVRTKEGRQSKRGWVITHLASGMTVGPARCRTLEVAFQVADYLVNALGLDWTQDRATMMDLWEGSLSTMFDTIEGAFETVKFTVGNGIMPPIRQ